MIERVAQANDVPFVARRGYVSASAAWTAAQRIEGDLERGAESVVILHLGDHDPSGIDMTRDIMARLTLLLESDDFEPRERELLAAASSRWGEVVTLLSGAHGARGR